MSGRPIYFDPSKSGQQQLTRAEKLLDAAALLDDGVDLIPRIELETPSHDASDAPAALDAWALAEWIRAAAASQGCARSFPVDSMGCGEGCICVELFQELGSVATALRSEEIVPPARVSPEDQAATLADLLKVCEDPAEQPLLEQILQHIPTANLLNPWVHKWAYDTNRLPRPTQARELAVSELAEVIRLAQAGKLTSPRGRPRAREESSDARRTRIVGHCQPIIQAVERLMPYQLVNPALWFQLFDLFFLPERPGTFNTDYRHALQAHRDASAGISEKG